MAALYSDARANATEGETKAMTGEQRAWLRQREGCKGTAKEWTCLRQLYGSRIAQLTAGGPTRATEASGDAADVAGGASAALPEIVRAEDPGSSTEPAATGEDARAPPRGRSPQRALSLPVQSPLQLHHLPLSPPSARHSGQTPVNRPFMKYRSADKPVGLS